MGILGNALNSLITQGIKMGFGQLDNLITRKVQEGKLEEASLLAEQFDRETVDKQMIAFNLVNPQSLPGISGLVPGSVPRGQGDLNNPDIQAQISSARQTPKSFFELGSKGDTGILGQQAVNRNQQFLSNDPFIAAQKERQRQQGKAFDTTAGVVGKQGDLGNLGINEIGGQVLNPTLTLDEGRQRSRDTVKGLSQARAEGRDTVAQKREQRKGGSKGSGSEKPTRFKGFEIKIVREAFLEDPDFSENDIQNRGKRKLTPEGRRAVQLAVLKGEEEGLSPTNAVKEVKTDFNIAKSFPERTPSKNPIEAVRRLAPGSKEFIEIQGVITAAQEENLSPGQIKALLRKDGVDPSIFGL